jgi:hypothetical protein
MIESGGEFSWLERLPVTREAAGSSPVLPPKCTKLNFSILSRRRNARSRICHR